MSDKQDRIFDGWADRFDQRIYADNNPKGRVRQAILQRDLTELLSQHARTLDIVDVGGGLGHMAIWLANQGHSVTVVEPSGDMLERARQNADAAGVEMQFVHSTLQDFSATPPRPFDLIVCHAVLEWLAQPRAALDQLKGLMHTQSHLSLMFYNVHSARMRSLVVGDFGRANSANLGGDGIKRLAPLSPLDPQDVHQWLETSELVCTRWSGVRTFYDYMLPDARARADTEQVIRTELALSEQEPWRSMARYQHVLCTLPSHDCLNRNP